MYRRSQYTPLVDVGAKGAAYGIACGAAGGSCSITAPAEHTRTSSALSAGICRPRVLLDTARPTAKNSHSTHYPANAQFRQAPCVVHNGSLAYLLHGGREQHQAEQR